MEGLIGLLQAAFVIGICVALIALALVASHYIANMCRAFWSVLDRRKQKVDVSVERRRKRWYSNK